MYQSRGNGFFNAAFLWSELCLSALLPYVAVIRSKQNAGTDGCRECFSAWPAWANLLSKSPWDRQTDWLTCFCGETGTSHAIILSICPSLCLRFCSSNQNMLPAYHSIHGVISLPISFCFYMLPFFKGGNDENHACLGSIRYNGIKNKFPWSVSTGQIIDCVYISLTVHHELTIY